MRAVVSWTETPPEKDSFKNVCYDLCFRPDGSQLVAAVGARVLVYDANSGDLLHALKGHKAPVYSVAYASNGKRFASGGADKTVIIWTSKAEGILKYTHSDSVQCLAYNPATQQLASGTATDLGLWSPEAKAVTKHKVSSKVLCLAWTPDGLLLAAGCYDGGVSIRDRGGAERVRVAAGVTPAWSVAWSPGEDQTLAVGLLDGYLRFFTAAGTQKHKDRTPQGDPLTLAYFAEDYLFVAGTDNSIQVSTHDGIPLTTIPGRGSWSWRIAARPNASYLAVGCEDGSISMLQVVFGTVHGLYGNRYAYRDVMTDVIVQHLLTEQKVRIKCRDFVKKVAIYRDRVAVQLPSRVVLYELAPPPEGSPSDDIDMQYRSGAKISAPWECNLLVVASAHLVLCQDKKLSAYDFEGVKQREWTMDAVIRYIKVVGGPPKREALLVGLKSGAVVKVFVDNPFPIPLMTHSAGVRCLDASATRRQLAVVDEHSKLAVYDLENKAVTFEADNVNSVAWNADSEGMLAYSGGGNLSIRAGDFPPHSQRMGGFVVGFKGSKVFCLQSSAMQTIDVPLSAPMFRHLEKKDWRGAYEMACLGVTENDWRALALAALQALELGVARAAFIRVRDPRAVDLADRLAAGLAGGMPRGLLLGDALAWQGRYAEAARCFANEGRLDKVLDMFTALRQFDEANKWADEYARLGRGAGAKGVGDAAAVGDLLGKHAEWSEATKDFGAAADMFIRARRWERALALITKHGLWDRAPSLVHAMGRDTDAGPLAKAAAALAAAGQYAAAKEALLRLGDTGALVDLAVAHQRWDEAELFAAGEPGLAARAALPRARWLVAQGRLDEARAAYRLAGRADLGRRLLEGAADAAVRSRRFGDAAKAQHALAVEALQDAVAGGGGAQQAAQLRAYAEARGASLLYAAYAVVDEAARAPFRTAGDTTLFGAARFLVARLLQRPSPPPGVSLAACLHALGRTAEALGTAKTARLAYSKLQALALPPEAQWALELALVSLRAAPHADPEDMLPRCARCGATNPLVGPRGDVCVSCGCAFEVCPLTWDLLPLVRFELEAGLDEQGALALLGEDSGCVPVCSVSSGGGTEVGGAGGSGGGGANVLRLDAPGSGGAALGDAVSSGRAALDESWAAQAMVPGAPVVLDRAALRQLRPAEVLLRRASLPPPCGGSSCGGGGAEGGDPLPGEWLRVMDADAGVVAGACGHCFDEDEYDMWTLEHGTEPISGEPVGRGCGGVGSSHEAG